MLEIQRIPKYQVFVRAYCAACGLGILNVAAAKLAVRGYGKDTQVRLLHSDCSGHWKAMHPKGWQIMEAQNLFKQLVN